MVRAAFEPVIGDLENDRHMNRDRLARQIGDAANTVLTAVGYNFRRLLT